MSVVPSRVASKTFNGCSFPSRLASGVCFLSFEAQSKADVVRVAGYQEELSQCIERHYDAGAQVSAGFAFASALPV
eukprot:3117906-Rhodomonas_salina.1